MKNSASGIITAFLAGAAIGVLAGILIAPDKGTVTRSRLKTLGEELGNDLADTFEEFTSEVSPEAKPARKKASPAKRGKTTRSRAKKAEE